MRKGLATDVRLFPRGISVDVHCGVVTLMGRVSHAAERWVAAEVADLVTGVRAIANEIEVHAPQADERSDIDVTQQVAIALKSNGGPSGSHVVGYVSGGWVTLQGEVCCEDARKVAEAAVRSVSGIRGIVNSLAIVAHPKTGHPDTGLTYTRCLSCLAGERVHVEVQQGHATRTGTVRTDLSRNDVACATWTGPGILRVDNRLIVRS